MSYYFERYNADNFEEVEKIFYEVFGHSEDLDSMDLKKKLDTSYTGVSNLMVLTRFKDGSLAGALGMYTVLMRAGNKVIKAGQLGDAVVYSEHRGNGLYAKMILQLIEIAKQEDLDLIYALPNPYLVNSLRKINFEEVDVLQYFSLPIKASLFSRLLRRLNKKLYKSYCSSKLKKCSYQKLMPNNSDHESDFLMVQRDQNYKDYKSFNLNECYELKTAYVWLHISQFGVKLGDYKLKAGIDFDAFLEELKKITSQLGKDSIELLQNENYSNSLSCFPREKFEKRHGMNLMIYYNNEELRNKGFSMNFVDADTF